MLLDSISSESSTPSGTLTYPGRRVRLCTLTTPKVCACKVGTSITTCCSGVSIHAKRFREVPVYYIDEDTFTLFFRRNYGSEYIQGHPNALLTSASIALLDLNDCSAFKFQPRAVVPSAHTLALETKDHVHHFLTLKQCCSADEPDVVVEEDLNEYNSLLDETQLQMYNYPPFSSIDIPDECL